VFLRIQMDGERAGRRPQRRCCPLVSLVEIKLPAAALVTQRRLSGASRS
jgi:hypothetical protein